MLYSTTRNVVGKTKQTQSTFHLGLRSFSTSSSRSKLTLLFQPTCTRRQHCATNRTLGRRRFGQLHSRKFTRLALAYRPRTTTTSLKKSQRCSSRRRRLAWIRESLMCTSRRRPAPARSTRTRKGDLLTSTLMRMTRKRLRSLHIEAQCAVLYRGGDCASVRQSCCSVVMLLSRCLLLRESQVFPITD